MFYINNTFKRKYSITFMSHYTYNVLIIKSTKYVHIVQKRFLLYYYYIECTICLKRYISEWLRNTLYYTRPKWIQSSDDPRFLIIIGLNIEITRPEFPLINLDDYEIMFLWNFNINFDINVHSSYSKFQHKYQILRKFISENSLLVYVDFNGKTRLLVAISLRIECVKFQYVNTSTDNWTRQRYKTDLNGKLSVNELIIGL